MASTPSEHARGSLAAAALFALLTLPFDPGWIDFESARRGLLLVAAGSLAIVAVRWYPRHLPAGTVWLGALCGWHLLRSPGTTNPGEGLLRAAHLIALAVLFAWGSRRTTAELGRAFLPAAIAVAAYGTAQAIGLEWPDGFARAAEPVSTLGNRNVASEVASLGFAAALVLGVRGSRAALAVSIVIGVYVGLNGSRAGLIACAVAVVCCGLAARRVWPWLATAVLAVALGCAARPAATPTPAPQGAATVPAPSTVEVRLSIWRAGLAMVADAPVIGHGSGQFRYAYPAYRTQREIELSTFGRSFPTFAENAHDDPLELAIETGIPGLLLALAFAWTVVAARVRRGGGAAALLADLAPVAVFATAALVRAPLGNAPAAAFAFAWMGALAAGPDAGTPAAGRVSRIGGPVLGVLLVAAGLALVVAWSSAARWVGGGDAAWLDRAVASHPSESRFLSLRIQARCGGLDDAGLLARRGPDELAACREDLEALTRHDPLNTNALFLAAQLLHGGGEVEATRAALARILFLDPREPRAQLLTALVLVQAGEAGGAVATLYANPHPVLRARLAATLTAFAEVPGLDAAGRRLLVREARLVHALDALEEDPSATATDAAVLAAASALSSDDHRGRVLLARHLQARGDATAAAALAPEQVELGSALRGLMAGVLEELRDLPEWRRALDR